MEDIENVLNNEEEVRGLTDWELEPSLSDLKRDLREAERSHTEQMGRINRWLDNLYIRGKAKVKVRKGNSSVVPRLIRKQAEWRYASLSEPFLSTEELINASPRTWEDTYGARQAELLLNHHFNTSIDKVKFIDEYIRTGVDEGTTILRAGWEYTDRTVNKMVPIYNFIEDESMLEVFEAIQQIEQTNPAEFRTQVTDGLLEAYRMYQETGEVYRPELDGEEEQEVTEVLRNRPTVDICDPDDVYIDPSCNGDISKAKFIIYRYQSSKAELEELGRYQNLDRINLDTESTTEQPDDAYTSDKTFNFADDARKKFTVYEYWGFRDIHGTGVVEPFVTSWVGNVTIQMEENPYPDKELPFIVVPYSPVRRHAYGEPDGELLEDNQRIAGALTRGMIDLMAKSANSQTGLRKGSLDAMNRRKFLAGEDYEFNSNGDPRQSIFMHTFPEIPASAYNMLMQQSTDAESMTGVKAFNNGISGQSLGDVAAGVRGALDAASKRELGILRRLASGITQLARKWLSMCAEFMDDEEIIRITNDSFVAVNRQDIQGEYDIKLTISTAEEDNNKAQEIAFLLQTLGNNYPYEITQILLGKLTRLRKMPDVAKQIEEFQPQPDPLDQEIKMLEREKLMAEIEAIRGKAFKDIAGGNLDNARAEDVSADVDQKTLDFVEQENGTKQARELQLHGEQARANMELETHKAALTSQKEASDRLNSYLNQ